MKLEGWKDCLNPYLGLGDAEQPCADVPGVTLSSLGTCYFCLLVFGTIAAMGLLREMMSGTVKTHPVIKPPSPLTTNLLFPLPEERKCLMGHMGISL